MASAKASIQISENMAGIPRKPVPDMKRGG